MEVFRSETRELIRRFLAHRISFPACLAALDAAAADVTPRLAPEEIAPLRRLVLENNDMVMREMERRDPTPFGPEVWATLDTGITLSDYRAGQVLCKQGEAGDAVFYIQKGRVKLSVVSKFGKQGVLGVLGTGSFLGEGCLKGRPHAVTAAVVGKAVIVRMEPSSVLRLLSNNLVFSELFLAHLLSRTISLEEDMVYQILNSNEKRLARVLLLLANFGRTGRPKNVIPKIRFEDLAQMVGTTLARITFFMKKFRRLGFVDYNGALTIHNTLLNVVLHDQFVVMADDPFPITPSLRRPRKSVKLKS